MDMDRFDPEVYKFYRTGLEKTGFTVNFTEEDLPKIREDEIKRHAWNTQAYEVHEKIDAVIKRDDAEALPVRIYVPESAAASETPVPVILYFHGGGYIMGSIEDHDPVCGKLADACGSVVMAIEYRLAPEYPFPACIEDAVCAAEWAVSHAAEYGGDPDRLMAGGDSSGANISAVLALLARDGQAPKITYLILFYGTYGCIDLSDSVSAMLFGQGDYVLPLSTMDIMLDMYVPEGTDPDDIRLNPGRAEDLSNMPPSVIVSAELDPLRDDGEEFARRLSESGNDVTAIRMSGMMHGFIVYWQKFSRAEKLMDRIGELVRQNAF